MAQSVEEAIAEKRHLIVEAGTGTGKTLAYLLPVIRSGKRVIISTGTKNLQEQLFHKDVPFLERALFADGDTKLSVCYMKGRNNYLCRKKLYDLTNEPVLSGLEEIEQFGAIAAWEKTTHTGDRAELAELPEASALWHKLDARADTCLGQKCKQYDRCFITEMRRRAAESDIVIVNHHLFFADLAIKLEAENAPDAGVLPEGGVVIFDEAHELEEIAGNYFGISVSNTRMEELARDIEALLQREKLYTPGISSAIGSLRERSQLFFSLVPAGEGRFSFDGRKEFLEENGEEYDALNQALRRIGAELDQLPQKPEQVFSVTRRAQQLQVQLSFVMEDENPNTVFVLGGDFLSPSVESTFLHGAQMVAALNAIGLDYATLGNHEFDFGPAVLVERMNESKFRWLSANVVDRRSGRPFGGASTEELLTLGGLRVGFFGLQRRRAELSRAGRGRLHRVRAREGRHRRGERSAGRPDDSGRDRHAGHDRADDRRAHRDGCALAARLSTYPQKFTK